ncbi:MAG TPA: serine hydrolase domain-containing protein [Streptosporangiaceae bacterium]|jgi:CubicO group peptidase (beta-lactamase class C family)|nr:serine hydrolase domain-containing protein [Streptosporangiaceae bacterium]
MGEEDWSGVDDLIRARGGAAQLCVIHQGQTAVDRSYGCRDDSLFWLFSASKPLVALAVHLLAERGELGLDEPVARYWPEFAQRGKQAITVRQVLQHRGGLPVARSMAADALSMSDWNASIRAIETAKPSLPPGEGPAYHILSFGFILGELVQRVAGVPLTEFVRAEFLGPLDLRDSFLGLPDSQWSRHVPVRGRDPARLISQFVVNQPRTRRAVIPAAGLSATARDLGRLYQALLDGDLVAPSTLAVATTPSTNGELDRFLKLPVRWATGFQLGGERGVLGGSGSMGELASKQTFGHNGSYACLAWADPERQLVMAYLTNLLVTRAAGTRHMAAVSDAVRRACL